MSRPNLASLRAAVLVVVASVVLAGCSSAPKMGVTRVKLSERECLARAMYFESNRSSDAGMLAVGTVVMNRVKARKYGANVCEVVGAHRQFAPGVLTRAMTDSGAPRARRMADLVLAGKRHQGVQNAQFFHTAGYKFPYRNMRYVLVAGGNAFYDKTKAPKTWYGGEGSWGPPPAPSERIDGSIMVANVEVVPDEPFETSARRSRAATEPSVALAARRSLPEAANHAPDTSATYGGIPVYEQPPGTRAATRTQRPAVVASLDQPVGATRRATAIREDNGLREEDRWRDQDLAEETGRKPASEEDWRSRRDETVATAPLPETEPALALPRRPTRTASRAPSSYDLDAPAAPTYEAPARPRRVVAAPRVERVLPDSYRAPPPPRIERVPAEDYRAAPPSAVVAEEPAPSRNVRVASRAPRTVETRVIRPVEADPAAMGWRAGPAPVRTEQADDGYRPLSTAASDVDSVEAPRPARAASPRAADRSYGGVDLGDRFGAR